MLVGNRQQTLPGSGAYRRPDSVHLEGALAQIWAKVLEMPSVEFDADFFDLGGNSLDATLILSRVQERYGVSISLDEFFQARTVSQFAKLLDRVPLTPAAARREQIKPVGPQCEFPATASQRRIWFLDRFIPKTEVHNLYRLVRLLGDLDVGALGTALSTLAKRHDALRTRFTERDNLPTQYVCESVSTDLHISDLSSLVQSERFPRIKREAEEDAKHPFPLDRAPLWRARLWKADSAYFFLFLNFHHSIADGWSINRFLTDLSESYESIVAGRAIALSPLPVTYGDYAIWEREALRSGLYREKLEFWKKTLQAAPSPVPLAWAKPRPKAQSFDGGILRFDIPAATVARMDRLGKETNATRFAIGLTTLLSVLHRHTGQQDLCLGTIVANRPRPDLERLIGPFANPIALRNRIDGEESFRQALERIRETTREALANSDVPFESVLEALQPERDTGRHPFFQIVFEYHNLGGAPSTLGAHDLTELSIHNDTTLYDLRMILADKAGGGLSAKLEFNSTLFDRFHIERLIGHFHTLLDSALAHPDERIDRLHMLTKAEWKQIVREWNHTAGNYPADRKIHQLFEERAESQPDEIAILDASKPWTYAQLNDRANRLARELQQQGIKPGDFVGIALPRSPGMIVSVLAAFKAGAAYVPLDVGYPAERLLHMLVDTGTKVILTESKRVPQLPASAARFIELDKLNLDSLPGHNLEPVGSPNDLAYIIFTSGSTGQPKGVVLRHRPVVNTLDWVNRTFQVKPGDRLLFVVSLSFDLSVFDIFGTLAAGAAIRIATEEELRDPVHLLSILRGEEITIWDSAPAALQQLIPFLPKGQPSRKLRLVMLSGDWIPVSLPDQVRSVFPNARVVSLGGATEAAIWSNWYPIEKVDPAWPSIPYGKPIRLARYHILDAQMNPQPVGVPGELYIGGDVLADGYWNRPELTAERFLPDPFSKAKGDRLYKTGDLARYQPDGNIEFLGRIDHQVKIRGFRVEIGEIESVLNQHPSVQTSVVRAFRDQENQAFLAAFVVPKEESILAFAALKEHLRRKLPEYMVPRQINTLMQLPLTPNGKLDRAALGAPPKQPAARSAFEGPKDVLEELIAAIWSEVLEVGSVGRNDNFFELGGHSLRAARVMARLQERCGVDLRLPTLFERPTVAGLADAAREAQGKAKSLPLLGKTNERARNRLAPVQQRFWFLDRSLPNRAIYNVAEVYRLDGPLNLTTLRFAWEAVLARHEILRARFPEEEGEPRIAVMPMRAAEIEFTDLSSLSEKEREAELEIVTRHETQDPFNLEVGPVWRLRIIRLSEKQHLMSLVIHHIAMDERSRGLLLADLAQAYSTRAMLPPLEIGYSDYADWQWRWLTPETMKAQTEFWRRQLADCPPALSLPVDKQRPNRRTFAGETLILEGGAELGQKLQERSRRSGITPFMICLTAYQALLSRLSAQKEVCVGTPILLRHTAAVQNLVGCFVNSLPIRAKFDDQITFADAVKQVRSTLLAAFAHSDVPFEKIVEAVGPDRVPGRHPFFQTMFVYSNEVTHGQLSEDLSWQLDRLPSVGAKFDLQLNVDDSDNLFKLSIEYSTELFEAATVKRIGQYYLRFLAEVLERPEQAIDNVSFVTPDEWDQQHRVAAGPSRIFPQDRTMAQRVEAQVTATPNATAFQTADGSMTYAEWNARANRLAGHLIEQGVTADSLVGVCLDRTLDLPVALLAVAKAGGAYVPLDPHYPSSRLSLYIRDCRMTVLVTRTELLTKLPEIQANVVCLDRDAAAIAAYAKENPAPRGRPDSLFYVIYTSGSTGRPNGAAIENRNAVNLLDYLANLPEFTSKETVLAVSTTAFDIHVLDYWLPALKGMKVVLAPRSAAADGAHLLELIERHRVTLMSVTPATWRLLLAAGWRGSPDLKAICGGEAMTVELANSLLERTKWLWNIYGPTETTVFSIFQRVMTRDALPPVGRPVANTSIYLLDSKSREVTPGCVGEITISGAGVGRGYIARPELTAERFQPDLFHADQKMYRTGDLGRFRNDGNIECLGRADHQVKVRGFRIELGEVERLLEEHPDLRQAIVVARPDNAGSSSLHAYCQPQTGLTRRPTPAMLKGYLESQLPDYMIPASFTLLDQYPQTPSGKVDRGNLPAPDLSATVIQEEFIAPSDELEKQIQSIWEEVFGLKPIGVTANFFDLGGHSLQAAILMSKLESRLQDKLPLEALFGSPTIRGLANRLRKNREKEVSRTAMDGSKSIVFSTKRFFRTESRPGFVAPVSDEEQALQSIWEEVFQISPIGVTDDFYELGGDSVQAAVLMSRVQTRLGHRLPLEALLETPTIRGLAKALQKNLELGHGILVPLQTAGTKPPLFMIAGAGGHVFAFHRFARLLGPDQPSYGMKAIGVDGTEAPLDDIRAIARRYVQEILQVCPTGPCVLAGYSVGGTIALEVALQLEALGRKVLRVIAFDTLAPGYPRPKPFIRRVGEHALNFFRLKGHAKWEYLGKRYDQTKKKVLYGLNLHHFYAPTIPGMKVVPQGTLKRVWGALYKARESYWPEGIFKGRIVLVSSEQPDIWVGHYFDDPNKGWNRWCTDGVKTYTVPAAHMDFFKDENIELLSSQIREVLAEVNSLASVEA